jgi:hypothetical protein
MKHKSNKDLNDGFESLIFNNLIIERSGNNIIWRTNLDNKAFSMLNINFAERYPDVLEEIDNLITTISNKIRVYPAINILQRAWHERTLGLINRKSEVELNSDDTISFRMIDYLQSLIASVQQDENVQQDISDSKWISLRTQVEELFNKLNLEYQICKTANEKIHDPEFDINFAEFKFRAQI